MRIQWKVTLVVLLVLVGTLSAVLWKTQGLVRDDKTSFVADAAEQQIKPLKRLIQERLDNDRERLISLVNSSASPDNSGGIFEAIALVESNGGQWTPSWVKKASAVKAERWPDGHDLALLKSLPYGKVRDGEAMWMRLSDGQGSPLFVFIVSGVADGENASSPAVAGQLPEGVDAAKSASSANAKKLVMVGFYAANPLATLTEDYIGSMTTVYVVDDRGYVATHANKAFNGALFTEDSMVKEMTKNPRNSARGQFQDIENRPVLASWERVARTNLYAVVTTPVQFATGVVDAHFKVALATAVAVGLFGLLLAFLIGRSISQPLLAAIRSLEAINRGDTTASVPSVGTNDEIGQLMRLLADSSPTALAGKSKMMSDMSDSTARQSEAPQVQVASEPAPERLAEERKATFEAINSGFVASLREPLLAILGHVQLAKDKKAPEDDPRPHVQSIEREARRAKEVLERMRGLVEEPRALSHEETVDLQHVVKNTVDKLQPRLDEYGIEVTLDLRDVPTIRGQRSDLEAALAHVIENSIEAMQARPIKKLKITSDFLGEKIFVTVADSGVGMSRDVAARAFEPFFKSFESTKRMGLGLAFTKSTLKRHGADAEIQSTPGEGAAVTFTFPVAVDERSWFRTADEREVSSEKQFKGARKISTDDPSLIPPPLEPMTPVSEAAPPPLDLDDEPDSIHEFEITLGGKRALSADIDVELPPAPPIEEQGEPVGGMPRKPSSPPPPAGATTARFEIPSASFAPPSNEGDDDEEEESFASVSLSHASIPVPAPVAKIEDRPSFAPSTVDGARTSAGEPTKTGFQVKIRKPKVKA